MAIYGNMIKIEVKISSERKEENAVSEIAGGTLIFRVETSSLIKAFHVAELYILNRQTQITTIHQTAFFLNLNLFLFTCCVKSVAEGIALETSHLSNIIPLSVWYQPSLCNNECSLTKSINEVNIDKHLKQKVG